jgi:hypothetical protein
MTWYFWLAIASLTINVGFLLFHVFGLTKSGKPIDFSYRRGRLTPAIAFAFSGAMSPTRKESAFLHLPTYIAGIFYHLGTFAAIFLFFFTLAQIPVNESLSPFLFGFLIISALSGIGIILKRLFVKRLRGLSNPDDYISNFLVTLFQIFSVLILSDDSWISAYYIVVSLLLLYIPVGKLKHAVYFFGARYHLGYFYGWRDVWPPKKY